MIMNVGVSVIIPSFNGKKNVFRLLDSLQKTKFKPLEIIVVDNGSRDGSLLSGKKKYTSVKWIDAGKENIGQTGCYNLGFAYANKKNHITMVDSDVVVDSTMIGNLVKRLESKKNIGIVTPMILYLSDHEWVNQAGSQVDLTTGRVKVGWGPKKDFLKPMKVQNSGTVMIFKRELVNKIGGFDDWFLCYFDPDYCLRAKKAGFEMWYEPTAVAYHDQSKDPNVWRPRVLTRAYLLGRNRVLFMRKFGNMVTFTLFVFPLLGYYFIECLRFGNFKKFFELCWGTIVGYFYPINKDLYIPLPKV
jgi:GT2 family glycosyltransferase